MLQPNEAHFGKLFPFFKASILQTQVSISFAWILKVTGIIFHALCPNDLASKKLLFSMHGFYVADTGDKRETTEDVGKI